MSPAGRSRVALISAPTCCDGFLVVLPMLRCGPVMGGAGGAGEDPAQWADQAPGATRASLWAGSPGGSRPAA